MRRHAFKLAVLVPILAFLFWWGWSGNFAYSPGSLFTLFDQESFYGLDLGATRMGWARREIRTDPKAGRVSISEESVINLSFSGQDLQIRTNSDSVFDSAGRLVSAVFSLPMGAVNGQASATVDGQTLRCELRLMGQIRQAEVPLPPSGPVLVSGLVPWLSHQRNLPLGRPLGLSLLDLVSLTFMPAELVIEDATTISDELQIYKLTLRFMGTESSEWIDAQGGLRRQYNPVMEVGLVQARPDQYDLIRGELAGSGVGTEALTQGPLAELVSSFLANGGLDILGKAVTRDGQPSPWGPPRPQGGDEAGEAHNQVPAVTNVPPSGQPLPGQLHEEGQRP
ncbi:MAG: hypothetical protein LBP92_08005 [Deltaproteobacteria bacterium]|jgi:hypothetical protein|nr:hypothetical protein [Deltaproteobacteria bacterium]